MWSYQNQENEVGVDNEKPNRRDELPVDEQHRNEQERTVCVSEANLGMSRDSVCEASGVSVRERCRTMSFSERRIACSPFSW